MLAELTQALAARDHVEVLGALGFENAYALAMRRDQADRLGIHSIADLAAHASDLTLGSDLEFLSRPEWAALKSALRAELQGRATLPADLHVQGGDQRRRST